ncbi:icd [Symbiodinium natans]|uniref:Icd protein n=1 Tax=Symbiodinium natans TaxID=878477 RepID=A0A812PHA5_9DINO|nr:icd [Symbiodinium natans]
MQKLPGWKTVGMAVRHCLDQVLQENSHMLQVVQSVGRDQPLYRDADVRLVQSKLASLLGLKDIPRQPGLWSELLQALVQASGDPDLPAAKWPKEGTPLGIEEEIPPGGVFPRLSAEEQVGEAARLEFCHEMSGAEYNYQSYEEHREHADKLFRKEVEAGFAQADADRATLESQVGPLVLAAIGVVAKRKPGGGYKYRLVHDLRRNGVNSKIQVQERLILPRLKDAIEDAVSLFESGLLPEEEVLWLTLDFKDAFKQLPTKQSEQRYLAGQADGRYFYYKTVLFGVRTGPLVWCRVAALVSRATQALTSSVESRLELFIDDPLIALKGTQSMVRWAAARVLWFWLALGLKLAWPKGSLGPEAHWIGAVLKADRTQRAVEVSIPASKIQDWRQAAVAILKRPWTSRRAVQKFAGKMSWAAGVILQAKPYVQMLYAALNVSKQVVYAKQLKHALTWLVALFDGFNNGFHRTVRAHVRHQVCLEFLVDASPWGGGAVRLVNGCPVECFCLTWQKTDEGAIGAHIGQAASQAQWEAYMALRALWKWLTPELEGQVRIRGDAAGVLQSFVKRSSKSHTLSKIVREVTLHLALTHRSLEAIHLWSEDNAWADALSRLADPRKPATVPPELRHLPLHRQGPVLWRYAPVVRADQSSS